MRCNCCNAVLTDYEATRRHAYTKEFLDLCSDCFGSVNSEVSIPHKDRPELWGEYDTDEDIEIDLDNWTEL
jgi:hypothetical protein